MLINIVQFSWVENKNLSFPFTLFSCEIKIGGKKKLARQEKERKSNDFLVGLER